LPQGKLRNLLCHQFAARLVGTVNVRLGRLRRRGLSYSLGFEFCVDRCGDRAARGLACGTSASQDTGFRAHLALHALPCGSSASSRTLFRFVRVLRGPELPSFGRNAPEVCRKTRRLTLSAAPHFAPTPVKPFN
jgi:hypothetical protein